MDAFGLLDDDRLKDVGVRLLALDMTAVERLVEARAHLDHSGDPTRLIEALRAHPPRHSAAERRALEARRARLVELTAPAVMIAPLDMALEPIGWVQRCVAERRPADIPHFAELAVRARCDLPANTYLEWLLEPTLRRRFAPLLPGVPLDFDEGAHVEHTPALDLLFYGSERCRVAGIDVFPVSPDGRRRPHNHTPPPKLAALRAALEDAIPKDLFALRDPWRETFLHGGEWAYRLTLLDEEDATRAIADARRDADWLFVASMAKLAPVLERWRRFLANAEKRGWGIVAIDGLDA